jgi:Tfp pilus assembly protein PilF
MGANYFIKRAFALSLMLLTTAKEDLFAQSPPAKPAGSDILILEREGKVEASRAGSQVWDLAYPNQVLYAGDRLRTRENARVTLRWSDQSAVRVGPMSELQIQLKPAVKAQPGFDLFAGILYFFHRDRPAEVRFKTRTVSGAVRGTEFNLEVTANGRTILNVIDGTVELANDQGQLTLHSGEQAVTDPGQAPARTARVDALQVIQWCLYYPGVLDLAELPLNADERQILAGSLAAYREGDLLAALAAYPAARQPASDAEKLYLAALRLAVGQVSEVEAVLGSLAKTGAAGPDQPVVALAGAVRQVIAATQLKARETPRTPDLATEWLAESYYRQSRLQLAPALEAARKAVAKSSNFAFGWARVAELEFSFGHTGEALAALDRSLGLAPRNAEALALKGFLLSAQNKIAEATGWFERAIAVDGALGNAWLGRGLCRIRQGDARAGREDLLVAATVEPQRAVLRSYLGKAYSNEGDTPRAAKEIHLAKELDPKDPTSWLYSALLNQQDNRINEAARDLETSQQLNDNRSLYRSRLLLDQDRAVRSANLANIYRDAGMTDVSIREASRAVSADYANYSAHLFLASSYDQARDPKLINVRLETPANSEYLIANLLAPVGGGPLNPAISQQEYSRLFERDRLGVVSSTEYLSSGAWVQSGAQFGTFGNSSYSLGAFYRSDNGQRPNNDVEQRQLTLQLKQQLTPKDTVYLEASQTEIEAGDLVQYYDNVSPFPGERTKEVQEPILTLGYHHEWNPAHQTLLLVSWINDDFRYQNPAHPTVLLNKFGGVFRNASGVAINTDYRDRIEVFSVEPQHIWQQENHALIVGGRVQSGDFETENLQNRPARLARLFFDPAAAQDFTTQFERWSVYGYHHWQVFKPLRLIAGLVYDRITFPENFLAPPISEKKSTRDQLSPKAGFIWTPFSNTVVRFGYTRSLAGASLEQSVRIEPTEVAGFNQTFRSIVPESVAGSIPAAPFETFDFSLEQNIGSGTYLGISGEILTSEVDRTVGAFVYVPPPPPPPPARPPPPPPGPPSGIRQRLDYQERSIIFTGNQLLADEWSIGARYRLSQVEYTTDFFEIPGSASLSGFAPRENLDSVLHEIDLLAAFNHSSGFFSRFDAIWRAQSNAGYAPDRPGDEFWQFNVFAGYRFPRRHAELRVGLLNLTDRNYRLNPLTLYNELPRERTLALRLQFSF